MVKKLLIIGFAAALGAGNVNAMQNHGQNFQAHQPQPQQRNLWGALGRIGIFGAYREVYKAGIPALFCDVASKYCPSSVTDPRFIGGVLFLAAVSGHAIWNTRPNIMYVLGYGKDKAFQMKNALVSGYRRLTSGVRTLGLWN